MMMSCSSVIRKCISILICILTIVYSHDVPAEPVYHNQFAVHIPEGIEAANAIAQKYGFNNIGQIGALDNFFLLEHKRLHKRSTEPSDQHHQKLALDPAVSWFEQQTEKKRVKRVDPPAPPEVRPRRQFFDLNPFSGINFFGRSVPSVRRDTRRFPDPLYQLQWYLEEGASGGYDMNVLPAWQKGYTGKGVVISILDDGIQHNHPDLKQNYDPLASTDINDNDHDPMPRDNGDNRHGTRCAGEVAAVAFNNYCGVGVAYNASIGGVRMLDGTVNDAVEARAISLNPNHIDIYSASWGPEDDGKTVDGPGPLAKRAFINGAIRGRHGKGSIFVWASGNGGRHTDNCNCDGYTNSIFTLSISSATQRGFKPWYLEECSSTLASTYSSGTPGLDGSVATVDMDGTLRPTHVCTVEHTGTSASAPIAAGIVALALEANPDLTWRDMQHIVVRSSRMAPLSHETGWFTNGVGRKVSHKFGYGLIDAGEMVRLAEQWATVPPQHVCQTAVNKHKLTISTVHGSTVSSSISTDACAGTSGEVRYLEHVQAKVSLRFSPRGNVNIKLVSPSGTTSTLLFERPRDILSEKFDEWPFLSVHYWGEKAVGTWHLIVTNSGSRPAHQPGLLLQWQLVLHGTKEHPEQLRSSPSSNPSFPTSSSGGIFTPINNFRFSPFSDQSVSGSSNSAVSVAVQELQRGTPPKDAAAPSSSSSGPAVPDASEVCHSECSGGCYAEGPNNCRRCKHFTLQGECVSVCPNDTYSDDNRMCHSCHDNCAQCVGPSLTQCRSCHSDLLFVSHLGLCVEVCPLAYYAMNSTCSSCGGHCSKCSAAGHCTDCEHQLLLHEGTCHTACPSGYYETQDNRCARCAPPCVTCVGEGAHQCASCEEGLYLTRGKCVRRCPPGTYSNSSEGTCSACKVGCSSCVQEDSCTSCKTGWRIKGNTCITWKPDRCSIDEYLDTPSSSCRKCHSDCASCTGPRNTQCLFCPPRRLLFVSSCLEQCPSGYFPDSGRCLPCPDTCTTCTAYDSCTNCATNYLLHRDKCVPSCPDGSYRDRSTCQECHTSCSTCWGPGGHQCATCRDSYQLLSSQCYERCPDGYYSEGGECRPCYHNCNTCSGTGLSSCLSCRDGLTLDGGLCLECSSGRYYNSTTRSCLPCSPSCLTCTGQAYTCTDCQPPVSLHVATATCRPCCDAHDPHEGDSCCRCDPSTGKCYGAASADKRRIALSPQDEREMVSRSPHSDVFTSITITVAVVNTILFSALCFVLYRRFSDRKYSSWRRRFPLQFKVNSSDAGLLHRSDSSSSSDCEENCQLLPPTTAT